MILYLIVFFSFLLGVKIVIFKKLKILKEKHPEKQKYYDQLLKISKMLIIPSVILLFGLISYQMWRS